MRPAADRGWRRAAALAWLAVAAWLAGSYAPVLLHGYFLSDDFVPPVLFDQWRARGMLATKLVTQFWSGLEAGENHFYRPLSFLTFAINDALSGTRALPWMATGLALHVANGLLVAAVALAATRERPDARRMAAAAIGAAAFVFCAPSVEVGGWISGRFDVMATLFTLASVLAFLMSRRRFDAAWWLSLAAMVAACLSKESAAIVPFAILFFAWAREPGRAGDAWWSAPLRAFAAAAPWIALALAYLGARKLMFGSATTVYGSVQPTSALASPEYWAGVREATPAYLRAQFQPTRLYPWMVALTALQLALAFFATRAQPAIRRLLLAAAATATMTIVLLLPHVARLPPTGLGGRLLYQTIGFYAVLVAIALGRAPAARALWGVSLALLALHAVFQLNVMARWDRGYLQMRALEAEVKRVAARVPRDGYALVMGPQLIDGIPFASNAQAGLILPPFNAKPISDRVLVQIYLELPHFAGKIREGLIPTLRSRTVDDYIEGRRIRGEAFEYPSEVYCWDTHAAALAPVKVDDRSSPEAWVDALRRSLAGSVCEPVRF